MQTLGSLQPGEVGTVYRVDGTHAFRQRLVDMGFTPGTAVMVSRVAPLGDPLEIGIRGYWLTLRRQDANRIVLEEGTDYVG